MFQEIVQFIGFFLFIWFFTINTLLIIHKRAIPGINIFLMAMGLTLTLFKYL